MLRRNVLIFHSGGLGDFVLSWPLALAMGRTLAQSRIYYVTGEDRGRLAEALLGLEWTEKESGWHGLMARPPSLPQRAASLLAGAAWAVSFTGSEPDTLAEGVAAVAPEARTVSLRFPPPPEWSGHASEHLLAQLRPHPVLHQATQQMLRSLADRGLGQWRSQGRRVILHPGSGSAAKNWPLPRFVELAGRLAADGWDVCATLGEVELDRWSDEQTRAIEQVTRILRPQTSVELASELAAASLVVANDSGPAHLAAIIGVPTLTLFGPTRPEIWKPLGPRSTALAADDLAHLDVLSVYEACRTRAG
jgi:ADP-heptose:LPS heptosyltransferase